MKLPRLLLVSSLIPVFFLASCETLEKDPQPERDKISSMPHNIPQAWEGQAGFPGQMSGQY